MKFRKKPVVIDAIRSIARVKIKTLEGEMTADVGDWLITGVNGELYPCKPDIFAKTYEPADPDICPNCLTIHQVGDPLKNGCVLPIRESFSTHVRLD